MKQNTTHTKNTNKQTVKPELANKINQALVWYAFYDLLLGCTLCLVTSASTVTQHFTQLASCLHSACPDQSILLNQSKLFSNLCIFLRSYKPDII